MAEDVLIKSLPRGDFEAMMNGQLTQFMTTQADFFNANPDKKALIQDNFGATVDDMYHALHGGVLANRTITRSLGTGGSEIVWLGPDVDPLRSFVERGPMDRAPCVAAIITCAVDALAITFQAIGVGMIARQLARNLVNGIANAAIVGLEVAVNAITNAANGLARAMAVAKLASQIARIIGIKQILQALKDNLHWYQWVVMGVVIAAQIAAWFLSDGLALAAEIVIFSALLASLVFDAMAAASACSTGSPQMEPAPS